MHGHSSCNLCKCVDEHELKSTSYGVCMRNFSGRQTNSGEGTVRAKIASAIEQIPGFVLSGLKARANHPSYFHLSTSKSWPPSMIAQLGWQRQNYFLVSPGSGISPGFWGDFQSRFHALEH